MRERVLALLHQVAEGELGAADALRQLSRSDAESLPFATIDHHRALRQGFPEVIFAEGKTADQVIGIAARIAAHGDGFLATRVPESMRPALAARFPDVSLDAVARTAHLAPRTPPPAGQGTVLIITAGTSDLPVAEEAAVTAEIMGNRVERIADVGVAGLHRILSKLETFQRANVLVVVAGMEGALPSVVAGLVSKPVIAVPTSVGYGASFGGVAALLGMLNSCGSGVTVVNIDNGFGAGYAASQINALAEK
jgi:NCAIR mutase (PurE)-related protein